MTSARPRPPYPHRRTAPAAAALALLAFTVHADSHCADPAGASQPACATNLTPGDASRLPEAARAEADRLRAEMRFMIATGHAARAEKHQAAIEAIFREHGMALPEKYRGL